MQIEIANVASAPPEAKWIAPPAEATQREWCADMRPARLSDAIETAALPDPNAPAGATPIIGAIVYGVIGKDGYLERFERAGKLGFQSSIFDVG